MAGHIGIKRMDKRSQLQTFKDTVGCLQVSFPIWSERVGRTVPERDLLTDSNRQPHAYNNADAVDHCTASTCQDQKTYDGGAQP